MAKGTFWSQCTEYSVVNAFNINTQPSPVDLSGSVDGVLD